MAQEISKFRISDGTFLKFLKKNKGLMQQTADEISKHYKVEYSRDQVYRKAFRLKQQVKDIQEANLDTAESKLFDLMESKNETIKLRSTELYLTTKGKHRGYTQKANLEINNSKADISKVFEVNGLKATQIDNLTENPDEVKNALILKEN